MLPPDHGAGSPGSWGSGLLLATKTECTRCLISLPVRRPKPTASGRSRDQTDCQAAESPWVDNLSADPFKPFPLWHALCALR